MSHPFSLVPMIKAVDLPAEVENWCLDQDGFLYCFHGIVEVSLVEANPMLTWLTSEGYGFPLDAVKRGWGYVAIFDS